MGYPEHRGPLVTPGREPVESRNGFVPSPACQAGMTRRQEVVPRTRDSNPPATAEPFGAQAPQRDSAEPMLKGAKLGHNIYLPIPRRLKRAQGSTKNSSGMRISLLLTHDGFPTAVERASIGQEFFLLCLIDLGYAPPIVDSWCDDLLNDQIDDEMPMDLVDAYWGQAVSTQEFVEYYVHYEVCTTEPLTAITAKLLTSLQEQGCFPGIRLTPS
jgi:hypothetical protein